MWWIFLGRALAAEPQPPALTDAAMSEGQRVFVRHCSACHGVDGRGDGPAAPALQPPPADLTRIAQRRGGHFPVAEIRASIDGRTVVLAHGHREMPVWGERFEEIVGGGSLGEAVVRSHLQFLIEYLQSIQQEWYATLVPDPRGEMQIQTACSLRVLGNPCIPVESPYKMR